MLEVNVIMEKRFERNVQLKSNFPPRINVVAFSNIQKSKSKIHKPSETTWQVNLVKQNMYREALAWN